MNRILCTNGHFLKWNSQLMNRQHLRFQRNFLTIADGPFLNEFGSCFPIVFVIGFCSCLQAQYRKWFVALNTELEGERALRNFHLQALRALSCLRLLCLQDKKVLTPNVKPRFRPIDSHHQSRTPTFTKLRNVCLVLSFLLQGKQREEAPTTPKFSKSAPP